MVIKSPNTIASSLSGKRIEATDRLLIVPIQALRNTGAEDNTQLQQNVLARLALGEQMKLSVIEQGAQQSYVVEIDGQHLTLKLPGSHVPGAELQVKFSDGMEVSQSNAVWSTDGQSSELEISTVGRFLSRLLSAAGEAEIGAALPTRALEVAPDVPAHLATALQQAVAKSGLFYESHLQGWVDGQRSLTSLRAEPQGNLLTPSAEDGRTALRNEPSSDLNVPKVLLPIVRHQLDALASGHAAWRIEVWPGQLAELDIAPDEHGDTPEPLESICQATLKLHLPRLGEIRVTVAMREHYSRVLLRASDSASAAILSGQRPALAHSLVAAGVESQAIEVTHG